MQTMFEHLKPRRIHTGFTLVEILVVLSIIILLASMLFVSMPALSKPARRTLAQAQLNNIESSLKRYREATNSVPTDTGFGLPRNGGLFGATRLYDAGSLYHTLAGDVTLDKYPSGAPMVPVKIVRFVAFNERQISAKTYNDPERGPSHWIVDPWGKPVGYIGAPERLMHDRESFDLFSCGPDGKTAWDGTGECANGLLYGKGTNLAYSAIGDNNGDGVDNNSPELGDAALNGTLTKTKQIKLPGEVLDDISSWEKP